MTTYVTKRLCAGEYEVTQKGDPDKRVVSISRVVYWDGPWWVANAEFTRDVNSDPLATKREAVACAQNILKHWTKGGRWID